MKVLRYLALFSFAAGLMLLVVGFVSTRGDSKESTPIREFDATPVDTSTPTPTLEPSKTPTPTPTPFDGKVARMAIPRLKIDYPIEELGLKPNNELDTPHDTTGKIGWYSIYAKPGWDAAAIFSAHVNYNGKDGPFAKLYQVQDGDEVDVQMVGGPTYVYRVFRLKRYVIDIQYSPGGDPSRVIDMGNLISAPDRPEGKQWITLITCSCSAGRVINLDANGFGECVDRDVVVAERVQ